MKMKTSTGSKVFDVLNLLFLLLFAFICAYPFYYIFLISVSDFNAAIRGRVVFWPVDLSLVAYRQLLLQPDVYNAFFISAARAFTGTIITVVCSSYLAYVLSRNDLPFKRIIYRFVIVTMYVSAGLIPWYMTMKAIGLQNNFMLYIIPSAIGPFYVILVKTYIEQLPRAVEESAKIDGADTFTIFFKIIIPLSIPIITTIAIFSAVHQWNSWQDNLFLVSRRELTTLQLLLFNYLNSTMAMGDVSKMKAMDLVGAARNMTPMTLRMAMSVITVFPILFVYPVMQKYFIKGIVLGAVKG